MNICTIGPFDPHWPVLKTESGDDVFEVIVIPLEMELNPEKASPSSIVSTRNRMTVLLLLPVCAERMAIAIVKLLQISTAVFVAPNFTSSKWLPISKACGCRER